MTKEQLTDAIDDLAERAEAVNPAASSVQLAAKYRKFDGRLAAILVDSHSHAPNSF